MPRVARINEKKLLDRSAGRVYILCMERRLLPGGWPKSELETVPPFQAVLSLLAAHDLHNKINNAYDK
jgi:hypothetical protein